MSTFLFLSKQTEGKQVNNNTEPFSRASLSAALTEARERGLGEATLMHFATAFHRSLYDQLMVMLQALHNGAFLDRTGSFTKVLLGPRGIAKTTCLRNFACAAPLLAPNVASIFISFPPPADSSHQEAMRSGREVTSLCDKIKMAFNWTDERRDESYAEYIVRNLESSDTKLVLAVDDVDQLFKASKSDEIFYRFAKRSLSELADFGNDTSGRLLIVLSGSSSRLEVYINGTKAALSEHEKSSFPMLSENIKMNNDRYQRLVVTYARPDSLLDTLAILHPTSDLELRTDYDEAEIRDARELMFVRGCKPRAFDDLTTQKTKGIVPNGHPCERLWMQLLVLWFGEYENRKLLVKLGKRKQRWRDRLWRGRWTQFVCGPCKLAMQKSKSVTCDHATSVFEWEGLFKPVSLAAMYESHGPELTCALDTLQHEGYLTVIDEDIFPVSLGQYLENLRCWSTSLARLLSRRWYSFSRTPEEQLRFVDNLSASAKQLLKEAAVAGVASNM